MDAVRERRAVALAALGLLAVGGVLPPSTPLAVRAALPLLAAGLAAATWRRATASTGLAVLVAALLVGAAAGVLWQLTMPLALGVLALASRLRPALGAPVVERGALVLGGTLACALVTPGALVGWVYFLRPDLGDLTRAIPAAPVALLLAGAAAFALVNALFEEWIWRGVLQPRLSAELGAAWGLALQALSFGLAHAWGFPRGVVGVLLAGTWAVLLGLLRQRAGGLLAVVLAHIVADATIAAIVLFWLR